MAVALDAVSPSAAMQKNNSSSGALGTWNHTVTGSNTLLLVVVGVGTPSGSSDANTVGVTFGASTVDSVSSQIHANGGTSGFIQLFALKGATGTQTITVTVTGTYHKDIIGAAISFTGVDQTTALGTPSTNTGSGTTASPTAAIASATGNMVFAFECNGSGTSTTCNNATERFDGNQLNSSTACTCMAGSTAPGATTVNPTFTVGNDWWAYIGVDIKAASTTSAISFTDSGAGTDSVGVAAAASAADSGVAADQSKIATSAADNGAATDSMSASAAVPVADAGAGITVLSVSAAISVSDSGAASATSTVTAAIPVVDAGTSTDSSTIAVGLVETGAGTDSVTVAAVASSADTGVASDAILVDQGATPKSLADDATAFDAVTNVVAVTSADAAIAADSVNISATFTVYDVASAADTFTGESAKSGPYYGITATDLADGLGVWVNPSYALADDGLVATWTAP